MGEEPRGRGGAKGFAALAATRERKWGRPWSMCVWGKVGGGEGLRHVGAMLGGIDPHCLCCRWADLYVLLSNRKPLSLASVGRLVLRKIDWTIPASQVAKHSDQGSP